MVKLIIRWIIRVGIGVEVFVAVAIFLLSIVLGSRLVVVLSGSMEPTLPVGAIALMQAVNPITIQVGDIISFKPPQNPKITITHRVIGIVTEPNLAFQTKGDAVKDPDSFAVPAGNVVGKVSFRIPQLGYILYNAGQYVRHPLGFGLLLGLPSIIIIGSETRNLMLLVSSRSRRVRLGRRRIVRLKKRWPKAARRLP